MEQKDKLCLDEEEKPFQGFVVKKNLVVLSTVCACYYISVSYISYESC